MILVYKFDVVSTLLDGDIHEDGNEYKIELY